MGPRPGPGGRLLDHMGHGEGLAGPGHAQQNLIRFTPVETIDQVFNGLRLIARWRIIGDQLEICARMTRRVIVCEDGTRQFLCHWQVLRLNFRKLGHGPLYRLCAGGKTSVERTIRVDLNQCRLRVGN